ncbi:MAG: aldo/keto reductase [Clostridiales bacterium]|nr:aldo/keto reductase [Clostridiales bacterium]
MKYIKLGNSDIKVSTITFGTWAMGAGKEWGKSLEDSEYIKTLNTAYDNGITFFDTANGYGGGHSEEVLGKAFKSKREKIIISTKSGSPSLIENNAEKTVDDCLRRLQTDYIDVFLIHWPNVAIDVRKNMEQLNKLKEKGKIRSIGVSNFTIKHIKRAITEGQIDVFQPCYSLYWRKIENGLLDYCKDNNIGVMTYSSIASGLLTGKFTKDWVFDDTDMRKNKIALYKKEVFEKAIDTNELLKKYADKYQKTLAQIAINWVINKEGITTAIVGAKKSSQVIDNVKATDFIMEKSDYDAIGKIAMSVYDMVNDWDTMYQKDDPRMKLD